MSGSGFKVEEQGGGFNGNSEAQSHPGHTGFEGQATGDDHAGSLSALVMIPGGG